MAHANIDVRKRDGGERVTPEVENQLVPVVRQRIADRRLGPPVALRAVVDHGGRTDKKAHVRRYRLYSARETWPYLRYVSA